MRNDETGEIERGPLVDGLASILTSFDHALQVTGNPW